MNRAELDDLLAKFEQGTLSPEEESLLFEWFANEAGQDQWKWRDRQHMLQTKSKIQHLLLEKIRFVSASRRKMPLYRYIAAAAAIFVLAITTWYVSTLRDRSEKTAFTAIPTQTMPEIPDVALLILEDGTSIQLNDGDDPLLSMGSHSNAGSSKAAGEVLTIQIPKGGNFRFTLSDGTKVWMNAESSLSYPVSFTGEERSISLTGEAYFEVAKDLQKPFTIESKGDLVVVTGTKFNLRAYPDEPSVAVALLEGGVNLKHEQSVVSIKPGQQAVSRQGEANITCTAVDVENEIAWINGHFVFDNQDITYVMNSLARWYDVEVEFRGPPSNRKLNGTIAKSRSLEEVLSFLGKVTNIRFEHKEGRVYVML